MGFYIRKALKVGPLRFNLSKSGVGVSAGIKGLRFGTGPRGNYVHMGRGGLYFRRSLNLPRAGTPLPAGTPSPVPAPSRLPELPDTTEPLQDIDSGSVLQMVDASSAELLKELNEKRKRTRLLPPTIVLSVVLLLLMLGGSAPPLLVVLFGALAIGACWWVSMKDALRKTTVILYELGEDVERAYQQLHDAFTHLSSCARTWHIEAEGEVLDRKYHAGANAVVRRKPMSIAKGAPPFVRTNVEVPLVPVGRQTLAFMPDRLLVFDTGAVGAVPYAALTLAVTETQFVEGEAVPHDAAVVGRTWRYVNKKGGPDRRFNDNPEMPICAYDQLHFSSPTGLNELIQLSRRGVGDLVRAALASMQTLRIDERAGPGP